MKAIISSVSVIPSSVLPVRRIVLQAADLPAQLSNQRAGHGPVTPTAPGSGLVVPPTVTEPGLTVTETAEVVVTPEVIVRL